MSQKDEEHATFIIALCSVFLYHVVLKHKIDWTTYAISFSVIQEVALSPQCTLCYSHRVLLLYHGKAKRLQIQNIWSTLWFLTWSCQLTKWHLMEYSVGFLHDWQGSACELAPARITVRPILRERLRIIDSLAVTIDLKAKLKLKMFVCHLMTVHFLDPALRSGEADLSRETPDWFKDLSTEIRPVRSLYLYSCTWEEVTHLAVT